MSGLKLVVFDCDGTLIDSQHMIVAAMGRAFEQHGLAPLPRSQVLGIVGLSLDEAIHALLPDLPDDARWSVRDAYKNAFFELRQIPELSEPLFPGAFDTLAHLASRTDVVLGVATGKSRKGLAHALSSHGLHDFFVTLQTADDAPSKPHPAMLLQAAQESGVAARDVILVGDTVYDVVMAKNAGATGIGVSWGYHEAAALHEAGADLVLNAFDELTPALERIWSAASAQERA